MGGKSGWASLALLVGLGCGSGPVLRHATPPWPETHTKILVVLDEAGAVVGSPAIYGPGAPIDVTLSAAARRIQVLTFVDADGDLDRCGVRIGGSQPRLPSPDSAFEADVLPDGSSLDLRPRAMPPDLDLRFDRCAPGPTFDCPRMRITALSAPVDPDTDMHAMTLYQGQVYMSAVGGVVTNKLFRLEGDRFEVVNLPEPVGDRGGFRNLTAAGDELWATQGDRAYVLGPDLRVRSSTKGPTFIETLSVEAPGGPAITTEDGDGQGAFHDLSGQLPGFAERAHGSVLLGPDRRWVLIQRAILRWRDGAWDEERPFELTEAYSALGGDADQIVAANTVGGALVRSAADGRWTTYPAAEGHVVRLRVALSLGPRRALVAGNDGHIALIEDGHWCVPETRDVANTALSSAVLDGVVYLGTGHFGGLTGDVPPVLRVEIMDP